MKITTISSIMCTLLLNLFIASKAMSQELPHQKQGPAISGKADIVSAENGYAYKLFIAPNKVYGYNIFKDGRIILHQPALPQPAGDKQASLVTKVNAEKAAVLAIQKITKGLPPEITRQDLKHITGH